MKKIAIIGAQFGDESKARITHLFSPNYRWIIRFSSGANCGHTIYSDNQKIVRSLLPSIDFRNKDTLAFLGSGMAIDLPQLIKELEESNMMFPEASSRVYVDPDASIVLQEHKDADLLKNKHIGTTGKGIGNCYSDKVNRKAAKISDYIRDNNPLIEKLKQLGCKFKYNLELKQDFINSNCLFEGGQSILLSLNHGEQPYVTSCDTTIGGIFTGGFNYIKLDDVYGIIKCYTTRVGNGTFVSEIFGDEADRLRELGGEYGAVTGRPRRIGWLDLPAIKYSCEVGAITKLIMAKCDILNGMKQVPVCNKYDIVPYSGAHFAHAKPEYINLPGWRDENDPNLAEFIKYVENNLNIHISHYTFGIGQGDICERF